MTLKRAKLLPTKPRTLDNMTLEEIVAKFSDAINQFDLIDAQPSDTDLTQIWEVLALLLLQPPYEKMEVTHNPIDLIRLVAAYTTRYGAEFAKTARVEAYDAIIYDDVTTVIRAGTEAAHKAKRADRGINAMAQRKTAQFILAVIEDTWVG